MRFNEFVTESVSRESVQRNLLIFAEQIKKHCQPYLKENRDAINTLGLYRGVKPPGGHSVTGEGDAPYIHKDVRLDDRTPSDLDPIIHNFYNDEFQKLYHGRFRNAIFASGSKGTASDYGSAYIIFPIGNFQYIWSDTVEDLYVATQSRYDTHYIGGMTEDELKDALVHGTDLYNDLYHGLLSTYQTDELEEAIDSQHEIMIRASSYYGIDSDVSYNGELMAKLKEIIYG